MRKIIFLLTLTILLSLGSYICVHADNELSNEHLPYRFSELPLYAFKIGIDLDVRKRYQRHLEKIEKKDGNKVKMIEKNSRKDISSFTPGQKEPEPRPPTRPQK